MRCRCQVSPRASGEGDGEIAGLRETGQRMAGGSGGVEEGLRKGSGGRGEGMEAGEAVGGGREGEGV